MISIMSGPYRVEVRDLVGGSGAFREDANLAVAACSAVRGSGTISVEALVVGVLAWAVSEEVLPPDVEGDALALAEKIGVPMNMRQLFDFARGETGQKE